MRGTRSIHKVTAMKTKGESAMEIVDGFALDGFSITLIGLGILALLVLFAGAKTEERR